MLQSNPGGAEGHDNISAHNPIDDWPGSIGIAIALAANQPMDVGGFVRSLIISLLVALAISLTILHAYRNAWIMGKKARMR